MWEMKTGISKGAKDIMRPWTVLLIIVLVHSGSQGLAQTVAKEGPRQISTKEVVATIIKNRELFGRDFATALVSLPGWKRFGERKITVFSGQIVGSTPHKREEEARQLAPKLSEDLKTSAVRPNAEFAELLKGASARQLQAKAVSRFRDDDSTRIVLSGDSSQFVNPKLTVSAVTKLLGMPEKTVRKLIQTQMDRRPVVLTLHVYAGDTVAFAESDLAPRPGFVDRVILDVSAAAAALFEEAK